MQKETLNRRLALIERLQEEMDARVSDLFHAYCKVHGIHPAYGVESWDVTGDLVHVVQDTSYRGCYDNRSHTLPNLLHLSGADMVDYLRAEKKQVAEHKKQQAAEKRGAAHIKSIAEALSAAQEVTDACFRNEV